jgi:hypothetical protein
MGARAHIWFGAGCGGLKGLSASPVCIHHWYNFLGSMTNFFGLRLGGLDSIGFCIDACHHPRSGAKLRCSVQVW